MLTEKLLHSNLEGFGTSGRTGALKPEYFYDKMKISKANLWMNYYLQLKILQEAIYLIS